MLPLAGVSPSQSSAIVASCFRRWLLLMFLDGCSPENKKREERGDGRGGRGVMPPGASRRSCYCCRSCRFFTGFARSKEERRERTRGEERMASGLPVATAVPADAAYRWPALLVAGVYLAVATGRRGCRHYSLVLAEKSKRQCCLELAGRSSSFPPMEPAGRSNC
ncbi:hypothetical protein R3W88_014903 [Solanum pinnatisectum]|uniref:Uncharacterized protein n=1 Tax=Solanum pinnatisectum TaxID=50273 RepID=A0AAV9KVA7_9SOLN|nr:hypothetical protein R3W88_014903 [Solanum pinnatisectum]